MSKEETIFYDIRSCKEEIWHIGPIDKNVLSEWFLKISKLDETLDIESIANSFIDEVLGGERTVLSSSEVYNFLVKLINFFGYKIGNKLYEELRYREMIIIK